MSRALVVVAALAAAVLLGVADGAAAPAQSPTLTGTVRPDFTISLTDAQGNRVRSSTRARTRSRRRPLRLPHVPSDGPGVDERTEVTFTGQVTWTVTFTDGVYVYRCDPHPDLRGQFVAGNPQQQPPPPPPPPPSPPAGGGGAKAKLVVTAGPGYSITLKTAAGRPCGNYEGHLHRHGSRSLALTQHPPDRAGLQQEDDDRLRRHPDVESQALAAPARSATSATRTREWACAGPRRIVS